MSISLEQLLLSLLSGAFGAVLGLVGSIYIWTLSRKSEKRDAVAAAAGEWIANAHKALESNYMLHLHHLRISKKLELLKPTPENDGTELARKLIDRIDNNNIQRSSNYTSLYISLCKLQIECTNKALVRDMLNFTLCIYSFPFAPGDLDTWLSRVVSESHREPHNFEKHNHINGEPHAVYMRDGMRAYLSQLTDRSITHFTEEDPISILNN